MMRLAIVARGVRKYDGVGSINLEVAREAVRRGNTVTVIASDIDPELRAQRGVTYVHVPVSRVPTDLLRIIVFSGLSWFWLARHRGKIDLVIGSGFATFACVDLNIVQFVFAQWIRSPDVKGGRIDTIRSLYHWVFSRTLVYFENAAFRRSRVLVACSGGVRDELIGRVGIDPNAIVVVPNGVRTATFVRQTSDRERFGLPAEVPIVLFAGDITSRRKNLDVILDALVETPGLHLAIAAGIVDDNKYPPLARALGIADRVHFIGVCRDMPALMSSVDFFALFSHYEPFGLVVIEAMSCELPAVTARNVGASSVMTPESGYIVDAPATASAIAAAFRALIDDPTDRAHRGREARAVAERNTVEQMTGAYLRELEALARD